MANSSRHNKLLSRISAIERNLLPAVKISGNYTKKESDQIRSYVILVHAEIEAYFEDMASEKAQKSLDLWRTTRRKSNCLLSIMTFCAKDIIWDTKPDRHSIESRINKTVIHYLNLLGKNHGVKSKNIRKILLPLGVEESEFDQTWLNIMDDFGKKRGSFAHTTHSVQSQIDLQTEKNRVDVQIIPEITRLDEIIKSIK